MRNQFLRSRLMLGVVLALGVMQLANVQASDAALAAGEADTVLARAETHYSDGDTAEAERLFREALGINEFHVAAYGRLVQIALSRQDAAALKKIFNLHREFAFETPQQFHPRIQLYEMVRLRNTYNAAWLAAMSHQWPQAEEQFSRLLGDEALHRQALGWLFRLAMQQKNFKRAQFIAGLPQDYADNPAATPELLSACVLQRTDQHKPALVQIKKALAQQGAFRGGKAERADAQRAVYLAMIRLHEENDQCYLNAWKTVAEARPYFPALSDEALRYLAR